jgi:signal transduction histidine kinase
MTRPCGPSPHAPWVRPKGRGRSHLRRRIFFWFGASIVVSLVLSSVVGFVAMRGQGAFSRERGRIERFVAAEYALVFDDDAQVSRLTASIAEALELGVVAEATGGRTIAAAGPACKRPAFIVPIERAGLSLGRVSFCVPDARRGGPPFGALLPIALGALILWMASGVLARNLTRPLYEVARVAEDIGQGRLESRVRLRKHHRGEMRLLGEVLNEMADRIERQMRDQRALLAAVSHEVRTPLARLRLLVERARLRHGESTTFDEIDGEVSEIDDLVGELLANARIEFAVSAETPLDAIDLAKSALSRAGLSESLLATSIVPSTTGALVDGDASRLRVRADASLVARAFANLLRNANEHGRGVRALVVRQAGDRIAFDVVDLGEGFAEAELDQVFLPFHRGAKRATADAADRERRSLGLGLSLVRRIAEAHGGAAYAANHPDGGGVVTLELPRADTAEIGAVGRRDGTS